ncbi:hypothetical protein NC653_018795 [Populus alba x Populus x berolinensis]|uniref:Transmembrane protein n=1 Tax=Populus alba x Populus x berolinensis TaxID=444605 RepID=A0AAD6QH77_9ROSI|nr:hypothetical protein NC653_018795 [Populus alba x Populus x berolinensis]
MKEPRMKVPASVDTDFWVVFCKDESNGRTNSPLCVVPLLFFPRLVLFFVIRSPLFFFLVTFFCFFSGIRLPLVVPLLLGFSPLLFLIVFYAPVFHSSGFPSSLCESFLWLL